MTTRFIAVVLFCLVTMAVAQAQTSAPDSCNKSAVAIYKATPTMPQAARETGASGTAMVKVSLDATGAVTEATIYRSSGWKDLDEAALDAAKRTKYTPQVQGCKSVGGSYLYVVTFGGDFSSPIRALFVGPRLRVQRRDGSTAIYSCTNRLGEPMDFRVVPFRELAPMGTPSVPIPRPNWPHIACLSVDGTPGVLHGTFEPSAKQ